MKKHNFHRPELLAPAGNLETAVAAFSAGADAVYLGLGKFNARNRAENFQLKDLARLQEYARRLNKKVYVTLNTLVTESELPEFFTFVSEVARMQPDAVIVQDPGVIYMLRRYFPHLTLHASTQMNIHNSCGIKMLEYLGVKRVILERQITLEELRTIARQTTMELEVFVHGSLCISLSGRCLLSNYAENASGNRGMCRQLCRRNYRTAPDSAVKPYLSPQDLQIMQELPELAKLKIASLKIEGRLRGPDYVVPVVKAYRKALDELPELEEPLNMIRRTISRPAGSGALYGFDKLISSDPQAVFGRKAGEITAVNHNGMTVRLCDRIHLGDKLRIINSTSASLSGFELTQIFSRNQEVSSANSGSTVFIPGRFPAADGVLHLYKMGENGYDFKRQAGALPEPRQGINLAIELDENGLHITAPELLEFEFHSENFASAEKCAVSEQDLQEVFSATSDSLRGNVVSVKISGKWFAPRSVLKNLRRELFTALQREISKIAAQPTNTDRAKLRFFRDYQAIKPAVNINAEMPEAAKSMALPGFIAEGDLKMWQDRIQTAYQNGIRNFTIGGLFGIMLLKTAIGSLKGLDISAVYPLPAANSQAVRLLEYLGVKSFMPWVELPQSLRNELLLHSVLPALPLPEDCELLATRAPLRGKKLIDKNGQTYKIVWDKAEKLCKIYGEKPAPEQFAAAEIY